MKIQAYDRVEAGTIVTWMNGGQRFFAEVVAIRFPGLSMLTIKHPTNGRGTGVIDVYRPGGVHIWEPPPTEAPQLEEWLA